MSYPTNQAITYTAVPSTAGYAAGDHTVTWEFDDSTSATGTSVSKTWTTAASHVATATATNDVTGSTGSTTKTVTTKPAFTNLSQGISQNRALYAKGKSWILLGNGGSQKLYSVADGANSATNFANVSTFMYRFLQHSGVCATRDGLYIVFAGLNNGGVLSKLIILNTTTGGITEFQIPQGAPLTANAYFTTVAPSIQPTDDNKVWVAFYNGSAPQGFTFKLDPATTTISSVALSSPTPQFDSGYFSATLANSDVLGFGSGTCWRHTAATNVWAVKAATNIHPSYYSAGCIVMPNDDVYLIAGDNGGGTCYDKLTKYVPSTDTYTAKTVLNTVRGHPICVLLPSGKILVAGGSTNSSNSGALDTAEVYDPATNTWTPTANNMSTQRWQGSGCVVASGNVLLAGGQTTSNTTGTAVIEFYHPADNRFYSVD